ncbi:MAG: cation:proton antiporter [Chloroflexota bacterium]|nr:cation:proton antiporter [Chloroflexota bacterium]
MITMTAAAVALVMVTIFIWGVFSARLDRADLSAPIVFVTVGLLLSEGFHALDPAAVREGTKLLAEVTLVWVLFADASRIGLREFRADLGLFLRLLAGGLALTIVSGALLAAWLLGMGAWVAVLVGAALAPTDAALGASVMTNPAVPERIRRVLNVESGLNDGIATPVVMVAIAGVAATEAVQGLPSVTAAWADLVIGLTVGVVVGVGGGRAMRIARRRGWDSEDFAGPAVLALALFAYTVTLWIDGNGFVAAFVGGLAFGNSAGRGGTKEVYYVEQTAGLVSVLTWLLFGAIGVPIVLDQASWQVAAYAVLSLTLVRMLPVALALVGTGLPPATVAFVGWFGPRGLASVIFALIAVDELGTEANGAVAVIGMTVLISVFAHGLSARPLSTRYGAHVADASGSMAERPHMPSVRGLLRRHPAVDSKGIDRKGVG